MTKIVFFDTEGAPEGVAHFVYPEDAIESGGTLVEGDTTSDEDVIATWYLKDGGIRIRQPQPSVHHRWDRNKEAWIEDTDGVERQALLDVDRAAESARAQIITAAPGQAMTYEAKYQEALVGSGVLLSAEAEILGVSVHEVAASILQARQRWQVVNAQIEAKRLKAKKEIREAKTAAEMHRVSKAVFEDKAHKDKYFRVN
jgi:hypothetical protein